MEAEAKGYTAQIWIAYRQAMELMAHVRKGERGSLVVFSLKTTRTETNPETGGETERDVPFLKGCTVFNVEQVEGLPEQYYATAPRTLDPVQRITGADAFFATTGAKINHGGNRAYYNIAQDFIQMPPFESFRDAESYYATLAHEATHNAEAWIMPHGADWRPNRGSD